MSLSSRWALRSIVAHTGDPQHPTLVWNNPFATARKGHNIQWHDDEIGVAVHRPVVLNQVNPLGLGVGRHQLLVEGDQFGHRDPVAALRHYPPIERIQGRGQPS